MYRNCFQEACEEARRRKQTIQELKFLIANIDRGIESLEDSLDCNDEITEHQEAVLEQILNSTLDTRKRAIQCLERFGIKNDSEILRNMRIK